MAVGQLIIFIDVHIDVHSLVMLLWWQKGFEE